MSSPVYICNLALSRVGEKRILTSLEDSSAVGQLCKLHYRQLLRRAIEYADFSFTKKRQALAVMAGDPPGEWGYQYSLPSDCLRPLRIWNGAKTDTEETAVPFTVETLAGVKVLYTDEKSATLVYVANVSDVSLFSAKFHSYLAWILASELAMPLTTKPAIARHCLEMAELEAGEALRFDYSSEREEEAPDASWHLARGG